MTEPAGRVSGKYQGVAGGKHDHPSVSTVLQVLAKDGLQWGAAKESALFAVFHQDEWMHLPEQAAVERIKRHFKGVWDDKAARGTLVHDLALRWANGEAVDVPPDVEGYMDALENFYADHSPEWLAVERTVVTPSPDLGYAGTPDWFAVLTCRRNDGCCPTNDPTPTIGDYKTGKRYPIETTLQLSAYRYAKAFGVYDDKGKLIDYDESIPAVERAVILYLKDDGSYELLEVPADQHAFATFMRLRAVWSWQKEMDAWLKKNPERLRVPATFTLVDSEEGAA